MINALATVPSAKLRKCHSLLAHFIAPGLSKTSCVLARSLPTLCASMLAVLKNDHERGVGTHTSMVLLLKHRAFSIISILLILITKLAKPLAKH